MSNEQGLTPLSDDELNAQAGTALPDKEVASVLDLNADLDLGISAAAPIDLAVAANANVAAPIDAAASANILSFGSESQALADQGVIIDQGITADATADSAQDSTITQGSGVDGGNADGGNVDGATPDSTSDGVIDGGTPDSTSDDVIDGGTLPDGTVPDGTLPDGTLPDGTGVGALPVDPADALGGDLLNVNVDLAADADIAAPINGAVAANANVAAPIDAAVAANIGSIDSDAFAVAQQDAIITQDIDGEATASADQQSDLQQ
ncbi:peptidoglycan-binding protein [Arthrobacter sp. FW305-BF8]|uniref:peptidoglycan-binding protein n=1 Tax=Arthrobacter sp. FW305-BF8 TaxID=2879617 RepID=UPI001F354C97|nr:peptidoglycan-binding protein [Arthrobacter sp. FW305-BF8]UKA53596.1 peptidoglycan-binding protein [Arthrobacter sp. FW305-BF8]